MKKYIKPIAFAAIVAVILVLNKMFGWSEYLGNIENLGFLTDMVKENLVEASLIYCIITIIGSVVLALPGVTFAIFAGLLFGPWLGTLLCLIASTLGAIIAFVVGRFFLQESIRPVVMKNKWIKKVLFDDAGRSDIVVLMITRLVPLFPYNLQNFAYGITNIGFIPYSFYTFLFLVPGVALYTIGFAGFTAEANRWLYFAVAAVLFVLVMFLGWFVKKKFLGGGKEAEE
ncbi:MAG: TVP38/TMEM64 family protein [Oscillospiraceae bacterium]|nr:TVP38/TMEM64 family protein [Oscillospiraceae bacterium]